MQIKFFATSLALLIVAVMSINARPMTYQGGEDIGGGRAGAKDRGGADPGSSNHTGSSDSARPNHPP